MTTFEDSGALDLGQTAKGIAVRAGILSVASIVLGAWLFSLAARAASGLVKIVTGVLLLAVGGGVATWEVRKLKRRGTRQAVP
jgi:hypothetical protein